MILLLNTNVVLVLDTNVVLDWLLFRDARLDPLREALTQQRATVLRHALTQDELQRVLDYPQLKVTPERKLQVMTDYLSMTQPCLLSAALSRDHLATPAGFPQCRDADDQPFIALAFHARADALVSHDKAVLKLRKRARKFNVTILDVRQLDDRLTEAPSSAGA